MPQLHVPFAMPLTRTDDPSCISNEADLWAPIINSGSLTNLSLLTSNVSSTSGGTGAEGGLDWAPNPEGPEAPLAARVPLLSACSPPPLTWSARKKNWGRIPQDCSGAKNEKCMSLCGVVSQYYILLIMARWGVNEGPAGTSIWRVMRRARVSVCRMMSLLGMVRLG